MLPQPPQRRAQLHQALRRLEQHDLEEVAATRLLIFASR
ncbi:CbbQ/NirQ/NorQ domain-containing protein, partial [Pseudomonas aeruginosa]